MDEQTNKVKINLNVLGAGMKDKYQKKKKKKRFELTKFLKQEGRRKKKIKFESPRTELLTWKFL